MCQGYFFLVLLKLTKISKRIIVVIQVLTSVLRVFVDFFKCFFDRKARVGDFNEIIGRPTVVMGTRIAPFKVIRSSRKTWLETYDVPKITENDMVD